MIGFGHSFSPFSRKPVRAAAVEMGPSEGGDNNILHQADPGGAPIPARKPDRPQRYQGAWSLRAVGGAVGLQPPVM